MSQQERGGKEIMTMAISWIKMAVMRSHYSAKRVGDKGRHCETKRNGGRPPLKEMDEEKKREGVTLVSWDLLSCLWMQQIISHLLSSFDIFLKSMGLLSLLFPPIIQTPALSLDKLSFSPQKDIAPPWKYRLYRKNTTIQWSQTGGKKKNMARGCVAWSKIICQKIPQSKPAAF